MSSEPLYTSNEDLIKRPRRFSTILQEVETSSMVSSSSLIAIAAFISNISIGTIVFKFSENWSWIDSFYFTSNTAMTVGYGDFDPKNSIPFATVFLWTSMMCTVLIIALFIGKLFDLFHSNMEQQETKSAEVVMNTLRRRFFISLIYIICVVILGVFTFSLMEEWSLVVSLYFVTATVSTAGLGDYVMKSSHGKLIVAFYVVCAATSIAFFISSAIDMIVKGDQFRKRMKVAAEAASALETEASHIRLGLVAANEVLSELDFIKLTLLKCGVISNNDVELINSIYDNKGAEYKEAVRLRQSLRNGN